MNSDHDFRYPSGYNLTLLNANECVDIIDNLHEALSSIVRLAGGKGQVDFVKNTVHLKGKQRLGIVKFILAF